MAAAPAVVLDRMGRERVWEVENTNPKICLGNLTFKGLSNVGHSHRMFIVISHVKPLKKPLTLDMFLNSYSRSYVTSESVSALILIIPISTEHIYFMDLPPSGQIQHQAKSLTKHSVVSCSWVQVEGPCNWNLGGSNRTKMQISPRSIGGPWRLLTLMQPPFHSWPNFDHLHRETGHMNWKFTDRWNFWLGIYSLDLGLLIVI